MYSSDTARASLLAALMLLFLWPAAQAQSVQRETDGASKLGEVPPTQYGGGVLLYDQTDTTTGSGTLSQYNAANSNFDIILADDFTVPNGLTWAIDTFVATGFYSSGATTGDCQRANVIVWGDMGAGEPDAQLFNFDDITPTTDTGGPLALGFLFLDVPTVTLPSGRYWLSVVCEGDNLDALSGGRWNWARSNGNAGGISQIRNDGGGFGLPSGWNTSASATFGNDRSFAFFGTESGTALLPQLEVEQRSLFATAPPDELATRILTLRNTGTDDLTYRFPEFDGPAPATGTLPQIRFSGYPTLADARGGSVFNRTGSDAFGYVFKDNDEPDGPAYSFNDISATGTALGLGDDAGAVVPLPFEFTFYGVPHNDVGIASNGYLTFGSDVSDFSNDAIPTPGTDPNDFIAPFWDDLNPADADSDDIYYQDMGDGRFIVQWEVVAFSGGPGEEMSFQVVLFQTGAIEFRYRDMLDPNETATIGIESPAGDDGLQISFNELDYADNGRIIRIEETPSLFTDFITNAQPSSGTLAPGEDVNVTITFDASGLMVGTYEDLIEIESNDPDMMTVEVPATLEVVGPPEIFVDPLLLEATLDSGETETRPITITNTGLTDLEFSFLGYAALNVPENERAPANYGPRTAREFAKGEEPASSDQPQSFDAGGPDIFGYVWIDSNESGGPDYNFTDISTTGTPLNLGDDAGATVSLPFPFDFYGDTKNDITVSSNGYLTFGADGSDLSNDAIPTDTDPNDLIAVLWDDLNPADADSDNVYYQDMGDGRFIVQWEVVAFAGSVPFSFQAILFADGSMEFQYRDVDEGDVNSATVGIENADATDGLQIAFDQAYLEDQLAIRIEAPAQLVASVMPASGTVAPGEQVTVTATLDATELFAGTYTSDLAIASNDPVRPLTIIDVVVTVTGDPAFTLDPTSVRFGEVILGGSASETITVTNTGTDELTITSITSDNGLFVVSDLSDTSVAPGGTATFTVTFEPEQLAASAGIITVATNAGEMTISVSGVSAPAPVMSVTPESLDFVLGPGQTSRQTLTLQNDGVGLGRFSAAAFTSGDVTSGPATAELAEGAGEGLSARSEAAAPGTPGESTGTRTLRSGDEVTITHSESQAIVPLTGISCPTVPNAHLRVFDLSDFDIDGGFNVTNVEFGIESMSFQEATQLILYTLDGAFVRANLTEVARVDANVGPGDDLSIVSFDIEGSFDADDVLVVEWFVPTARPFFGGNGAGESSPTYLQASGCNVPEPAPVADLGNFPANHWVVNVTGTVGGGGSADFITVSPSSGSVQPASNRELVVSVDATGLAAGTYSAVIDIETNDPMNPTLTVPVTVTVAGTVGNEDGVLPTEFALEASAPNPSVGQTALRFAVPETSEVLIEVYDLMGRRVATLVDGEQTAGRKTVQWDASSLAGGVYVYRMTAGSFASTMKMVVVR